MTADRQPSASAGCCAPLIGSPLSAQQAQHLSGVLKALADPARLRLINLVATHEGGEACVCELTGPIGLRQPTVSHHLKVLVDAGLLEREKRGQWAYYRLVPAALDEVRTALAPAVRGIR